MDVEAQQLKTFLTTGCLPSLTPHLTPDQVVALLGPPDTVNEQEHTLHDRMMHLVVYYYGNLELTFVEYDTPEHLRGGLHLFMIGIYYYTTYPAEVQASIHDVLPRVDVVWYPWLKGMLYTQFKQYLQQYAIAAQRVVSGLPREEDDLSELIETLPSRTQVAFNEHGIIDCLISSYPPAGSYQYTSL